MKFLDYSGLQHFYEQLKTKMSEVFAELFESKRGASNGVASLNGQSQIDHQQYDERSFIYLDNISAVNDLYADSYYKKFWFKTINGQPIYKVTADALGEEPTEDMDITIDLSLYRLVNSLNDVHVPELNKIYLVKNSSGKASNIYTEYIIVTGVTSSGAQAVIDAAGHPIQVLDDNNMPIIDETGEVLGYFWEEFGKFKSDVDLTPYVKLADLDAEVGKLNYIKLADIPIVSTEVDGLMYTKDKIKLESITEGATADEAIPLEEIDKLFANDLNP